VPPAVDRIPVSHPATERGFSGSFNGRLRDKLLNKTLLRSLLDARDKVEAWRWDYNELRPHSNLGLSLWLEEKRGFGQLPEALSRYRRSPLHKDKPD